MKLSASHRLYGFGVLLLVSLTIGSRKLSSMGEAAFLIPLSIAGVAYLFAIRELFSSPDFPRRVVIIGLGLAALWHVAFLFAQPGLDDDVHRYVWDGRVQRLGYNPYVVVPNDPALSRLHTPETRNLNNPEVPSPYPPGAQLFFRGVTAIRESVFAVRIAFVICDIAIVFVLLDVLRKTGHAEHWVLAYAWHPLLATEVAGSGHVDIVGVLFLLLSFAALLRRWRTVAALAFSLAVSVKLIPIVLAPFYWKRIRVRDAILAAIAFVVLYAPFLDHGRIPVGSLSTYVQRFRFNDPVFATLERVISPQVLAGFAVLIGFLVAAWRRRKSDALQPESLTWPMAASLFFAPVVYPWYLLWMLPFLRSASTLPLLVWTISIIPTYYVWRLRTLGRPWVVPDWILLLEYGSVAIAGAIVAFRGFRRSPSLQHSADQVEGNRPGNL